MDDALRARLANEFTGILCTIREEKWEAFSEAARQSDLDPYVALGRLLVRCTEEVMRPAPPKSKGRRKPGADV